jgi:hypothetical protein
MSTTEQLSNERMGSFIETIINQARVAMSERAEDMLKAWHENIAEAHENETKFPPLKISISAEVNLEKNRIETTIRFTSTYQSSVSTEIPDPNQPELAMEGGAE